MAPSSLPPAHAFRGVSIAPDGWQSSRIASQTEKPRGGYFKLLSLKLQSTRISEHILGEGRAAGRGTDLVPCPGPARRLVVSPGWGHVRLRLRPRKVRRRRREARLRGGRGRPQGIARRNGRGLSLAEPCSTAAHSLRNGRRSSLRNGRRSCSDITMRTELPVGPAGSAPSLRPRSARGPSPPRRRAHRRQARQLPPAGGRSRPAPPPCCWRPPTPPPALRGTEPRRRPPGRRSRRATRISRRPPPRARRSWRGRSGGTPRPPVRRHGLRRDGAWRPVVKDWRDLRYSPDAEQIAGLEMPAVHFKEDAHPQLGSQLCVLPLLGL